MNNQESRENKNVNNEIDELCNTWLERMGVVQTFDSEPVLLKQSIVDIQRFLDESNKPKIPDQDYLSTL